MTAVPSGQSSTIGQIGSGPQKLTLLPKVGPLPDTAMNWFVGGDKHSKESSLPTRTPGRCSSKNAATRLSTSRSRVRRHRVGWRWSLSFRCRQAAVGPRCSAAFQSNGLTSQLALLVIPNRLGHLVPSLQFADFRVRRVGREICQLVVGFICGAGSSTRLPSSPGKTVSGQRAEIDRSSAHRVKL